MFKYVYEYEVMLPYDLHALNEMNIERKRFSNERNLRKSVILQNRLWKCVLTNISIKWGWYTKHPNVIKEDKKTSNPMVKWSLYTQHPDARNGKKRQTTQGLSGGKTLNKIRLLSWVDNT